MKTATFPLTTVTLFWMGAAVSSARAESLPTAEGFRGIWYMNQPSKDQYKYKYSGGMATYPQQHIPIAIHSAKANKTYFVFGGLVGTSKSLHHLVASFDHSTGKVSRPRVLLDKRTQDAHDNPTMLIDGAGYLWIFSPSHGTARPSFVHKSEKPLSIDAFIKVSTSNFSYPQPWHVPHVGCLFLHTKYRAAANGLSGGRWLYWSNSRIGSDWTEPRPLAFIEMGDYQISWRHGDKVGTAFDFHPKPLGLNGRTNIYYLETPDAGKTWQTVDGQPAQTPLTSAKNAALIRDFQAEKKLVYLKDLEFDVSGRPIIVFLTCDSYKSGPAGGVRQWQTARWTGGYWQVRPITTSDHNYDHGSFWIANGGQWRLIAPTDPGPQSFGTGGRMVLWTSKDEGQNWTAARKLPLAASRNHSYARKPVDAHPEFAALWADGNAFEHSESSLYFCNDDASRVWRLPRTMNEATERPERIENSR